MVAEVRNPDLKYCPRCKGDLEWRLAGDSGRVTHPTCRDCGFVLWQNPKPSVEAAIIREGASGLEVLLGRRAGTDLWDLPGNFLNDTDEIEATLVRECRREVGVEVESGDVLGVYQDTFHGSPIVDIVYVCRVKSGEPRPAPPVDVVRWFRASNLPKPASPAVAGAFADLERRAAAT